MANCREMALPETCDEVVLSYKTFFNRCEGKIPVYQVILAGSWYFSQKAVTVQACLPAARAGRKAKSVITSRFTG